MGETLTARSPGATWSIRSVVVVLAAVWGAVAVSVLPGVRSEPGFVALWDGWLQCGGYALAALLVIARVAVRTERRLLWSVVAFALVLRALAFIWQVAVLRPAGSSSYPSLADGGWLLSGGALVVAFSLLARIHLPRNSRTLAIDAVLGGVTAAALSVALLYGTLTRLTRAGTPAEVVFTNLAYPVIDVALLILIAGLLAASQWQLSAAPAAMSAGIVAIAVVDCVFLYQISAGTYAPGSVLTPLSLGGTALVALAAWLPEGRTGKPAPEGAAGLVVPGVLALVCVGVLADSAPRVSPLASTLLAAAGVGLAMLRGSVTLAVDRQEAVRAIAGKQAELERFQAMVEASGDFIGIADLQGRLVYLNPGGRRMVGLDLDIDVTGSVVGDYLTPEALDHWVRERMPVVRAQGHWEGESALQDHRGGPPIPVTASTFALRDPSTEEPWLLATVQRDISDRLAAERELQQLADQRQVLLGHLVQAQEDERARIAADVHDDSVQALAAVELRLSLLQRDLERQQPGLLPTVASLRDTVQGATDRLRHLLFDLESPAQQADLASALGEAAAYVFEDVVRWRLDDAGGADLPEATRVTAYRVAKEAMVNVRKHADAHRVVVSLRDHAGGVEVTVTDDGRGFDPALVSDRPGHLGLSGMRDRVAVAGGTLAIDSHQTRGTTVRIWLPAGG